MVRSAPSQANRDVSTTLALFEQLVMALASAALRILWRLVRWSVVFPALSVPVLTSGAIAYRWRWPTGVASVLAFALMFLVWRMLWPASFRRFVTGRVRGAWRSWTHYQQPWSATCALHGLTKPLNNEVLVPDLRRIIIGESNDVLTVRMLPGQSTTDWQKQAEPLAHTFGAHLVRVRGLQPSWVQIEVQRSDPLAHVVALPRPSDAPDLAAIPIGTSENGSAWMLRLAGRHVLVAGATGAGKGGVVWSLLTGLGSAIRDGYVQVWVIDPKGGMEFGPGQELFSRFAYDSADATLELLRDAASVLSSRAERLRGVSRQHVPSSLEPLVVVVIDEIASLTAYGTDRKIKAEVEQLLGLLLSQGRAVGVSVVACVQDPSKDVLSLRQLFPTRIALRLTEATQAAMVLGQAARDRGALCELIPDSLPGVAYVAEDGSAEATRVRAFHVTDDDVTRIAATYRPSRSASAG